MEISGRISADWVFSAENHHLINNNNNDDRMNEKVLNTYMYNLKKLFNVYIYINKSSEEEICIEL